MHYAVYGYYDPTTGQFLTVDPLVGITGQPFSYAGDDPVNGSDPRGLISGWGRFMSHVTMAGTWAVGWDYMSGKEQLADITLPIALPLTGLDVVSGIGDLAVVSVFGLGEGGTSAVALDSGAASTSIDFAECNGLNDSAACIGMAISSVGLGGSSLALLLGDSGSIAGGLASALGFSVSAAGAVWDLLNLFQTFVDGTSACSQK